MSRSCCPDCNRWRCVCLVHECEEGGAQQLEAGLVVVHEQLTAWPRARYAPCPPVIRERLRQLRDEFAGRVLGQRL